jgi:hypothetical protein
MIPNPEYKGEWKPRRILNPDYFLETHPHNVAPMIGIGIELWNHMAEVEFDNFYLGHDLAAALEFARTTWGRKYRIELDHDVEIMMKDARMPWFPWLQHVSFRWMSDKPAETAVSLAVAVVSLLIICANCGCCGLSTRTAPPSELLVRPARPRRRVTPAAAAVVAPVADGTASESSVQSAAPAPPVAAETGNESAKEGNRESASAAVSGCASVEHDAVMPAARANDGTAHEADGGAQKRAAKQRRAD